MSNLDDLKYYAAILLYIFLCIVPLLLGGILMIIEVTNLYRSNLKLNKNRLWTAVILIILGLIFNLMPFVKGAPKISDPQSCFNIGGRWNEESKSCEPPSADSKLKSAPEIATKQPQTKEDVLNEANEDYEAVLKGKLPIHAVFDEKRPILGDGGTLFYIAPGYKLTVQKKLDQQKGKFGYLYGPIIEFKEILENGKPKEIKNIKFYEGEALESMLEHGRPKADNDFY